MDPHGKFIPPTTEEEFLKRAKEIEPAAVEPILDSLKNRRDALVQNHGGSLKSPLKSQIFDFIFPNFFIHILLTLILFCLFFFSFKNVYYIT